MFWLALDLSASILVTSRRLAKTIIVHILPYSRLTITTLVAFWGWAAETQAVTPNDCDFGGLLGVGGRDVGSNSQELSQLCVSFNMRAEESIKLVLT